MACLACLDIATVVQDAFGMAEPARVLQVDVSVLFLNAIVWGSACSARLVAQSQRDNQTVGQLSGHLNFPPSHRAK